MAEDAFLNELEPSSDQQVRLTLESPYWTGTYFASVDAHSQSLECDGSISR